MSDDVKTDEGRIIRVWIEEDMCLRHGMCEHVCPEVFEVRDDVPHARIRPDAAEHYATKQKEITLAAYNCPTACIHIERK